MKQYKINPKKDKKMGRSKLKGRDNRLSWRISHENAASIVLLIMLFSFALLVSRPISAATPQGPTINYISNTTKTNVGASLRSGDNKGTITTINLDSEQQNTRWKAYVGNVTGKLTLKDAAGFAIYDWTLNNNFAGNVYASRNGSINWGGISCATQSQMQSETTYLNQTVGADDNINKTFNSTLHATFTANGITMNNCPSTALYVNGASQTQNSSAAFQEIVLADNTSNSLVFTSRIEADHQGYDPSYTYDFQMIVPDSATPNVISDYYFYIELQ